MLLPLYTVYLHFNSFCLIKQIQKMQTDWLWNIELRDCVELQPCHTYLNNFFFLSLNSWKWKMKIQLTCFNNRREAWSNQPQVSPFSFLTRPTFPASDARRLLPRNFILLFQQNSDAEGVGHFSVTHYCCIEFSFLLLLLFCFCI